MIFVRTLELVVGLVIVMVTLLDVFSSVLVPGPSRGPLRIATRVRDLSLPIWRFHAKRRAGGRRQRLANTFAPLLLFFAFTSWLVLLLVGFGLTFHASASLFTPPLDRLSQAIYVAGSSLLTLGVSEVDAHSVARWLILWAALSGFGVITATVTYILQVQSSLHQRESTVLTLSGLAGKPPAGIALLESFAALKLRSDLGGFFRDWRDWSVATLHSHVAYPVLAYFHSIDAESDWLSALGVVLDAATLVMAVTEEDAAGAAALMHRAGSRTVAHLCDLLGVEEQTAEDLRDEDVSGLLTRLERAGFQVKPDHRLDLDHLRKLRGDYAGRLAGLILHLGAEPARLVPETGSHHHDR